MSFLMIAVITKSLFSLSPDHRPAYFCVWFCFYFCFYSLDSRNNLQEHKTRAGGEIIYVNELYFEEISVFYFNNFFLLVTVIFLLLSSSSSLLFNSVMVSCEASTERDSNMQHLNYFPRAHAP